MGEEVITCQARALVSLDCAANNLRDGQQLQICFKCAEDLLCDMQGKHQALD